MLRTFFALFIALMSSLSFAEVTSSTVTKKFPGSAKMVVYKMIKNMEEPLLPWDLQATCPETYKLVTGGCSLEQNASKARLTSSQPYFSFDTNDLVSDEGWSCMFETDSQEQVLKVALKITIVCDKI